ncbi:MULTISPECIES: tlde1 domain-containing protein [Rhizobium]|uniref:DUF2778 domain-containing protein n=1 Tax=Rhizobium rhododendri TaxID=2506430 RepID=A0ABY8ICC4_9HYPH|nr:MULTISPECIES: tlde1 domain-containing protein [Rhizobium]MBZ5758593.1 DUF2778 domain-containing protein [Rhizobium sp. VS19-DR96]MBZ5764577.1 DUF2778 domain-containing protein [Rhizobium sp. VS19-DR129.2]MBZ5772120.1 DUF2778 domain-containing protein [Rhizobium sp. VS19-DRK62.2]MBZ5783193.1 DUF2778 domain-containing protein [Rhizobium sp. VS19-DR121]MBZ5800641.1 DUF2778 domain-containing protein [Rhizobium sp. VS19-DR181]
MAFAIETFRDVSPRAGKAGKKGSSRVMTVGTVMIGTGVVAFSWVVATAFALQGVVGPYASGSPILQKTGPSLVARAASQPVGHPSLRLATLDPAGINALALANAHRSAIAAEMAALAPSYSVIAKSDRVVHAPTEIADAGQSSHALAKSGRPLPADVMAALKVALAAVPAGTADAAAVRTASVDLDRAAATSERALTASAPALPVTSRDDRLALASAAPTGPGSQIPTPMPNPTTAATASAADRPVQMAMIDPTPAPARDATALVPAQRPQAAAKPARPAAVSTREIVPQQRPAENDDGLPSSAAAMVEPDARRANVAVEQTFGLVMPTASGDSSGTSSADDMLMSSIPLPTMRPAPSPDAATTPAAKLTRPSKALLAYARPDDAGMDNEPAFKAPTSLPNARTRVAIYDISAARVYLPNGEQLEAHSGLGQMIDNPRYVNQKNRGPTPPHTYDLTMRESLFHGVEAIRLNPVDPRAIYGRDGLLAHTYMLGRRGDSNGCVSFKDYRRFLAAFKRGEVNRLLVVPHLSVAPGRIASR